MRRQRGPVGPGGHHDRAAAHQELVDGEDLLGVEIRRIEHHEHVRGRRRGTVFKACRLDVEIRAEHFAQSLELVAGRLLHLHLLLHVGRDALGRLQGDGLQQAGGEALEALLDAPAQAVPVHRLGQRHLHHGLAVREREVEVEGAHVEQARRHGPEAVVGGDLLRHFAGAGARVDDLEGELAVRFRHEFLQHRFQIRAQHAQRLRQHGVRRDVAGELDRHGNALEHAAAALESVQDLLDGAGDVVLRVLEADVQIGLAAHLHLDQVAESKHLVFVAVLHQHVEVGVHQARLITVRDLEGNGADAVLGVRFVLLLRVFGRIDQFQAHPGAAGHFVFPQQVLQLGRERRQERVRLGAEVAAQQQGFAQLPQIALGGVGYGVLVAFGGVPAQEADAGQPQIGHQKVRRRQPKDDAPVHVPLRIAVGGPALGVHGVDVEGEEDRQHGDVEVQVAQVEHAARDGLEARPGAERAQDAGGLIAEQLDERRAADQVERAAAERGQNQGDDLVVGLRAGEQADAQVRTAEQRRRQVAGEHRPPVEVAQERHRQRQRQRQQQRHADQRPAGRELAEHELRAARRHRHHQFQRAGALLVAPHAHGERAGEEDEQDRQPLEHGPHVGDVAREERLAPEEDEQRDAEKRRQEQIGNRRREEQRQLLAGDARGHVNAHRRAPSRPPPPLRRRRSPR